MEKHTEATKETVQTELLSFLNEVFKKVLSGKYIFPHRRTVRLKNTSQRAKPAAKTSTEGVNIYFTLLYFVSVYAVVNCIV